MQKHSFHFKYHDSFKQEREDTTEKVNSCFKDAGNFKYHDSFKQKREDTTENVSLNFWIIVIIPVSDHLSRYKRRCHFDFKYHDKIITLS